jgi:hypothetical protein
LPESATVLRFRTEDVLQVKGLSDINGASEIDSSVYNLKCGDTYNLSPFDRLEILTNTGSTFNFSGTDQQAIHVDAITGYHENYTNAWINSGASLTDALAASQTMASVSGSGGENVLGFSPRFTTHQLWRLSAGTTQEEYVEVLDTQPIEGGSYIRLRRGVNGTTTASHAASGAIETFEVESDIEYCATELTAWQYEQAKSPFTNIVSAPALGIVEHSGMWPGDVVDRLDRFIRRKMYPSRF